MCVFFTVVDYYHQWCLAESLIYIARFSLKDARKDFCGKLVVRNALNSYNENDRGL